MADVVVGGIGYTNMNSSGVVDFGPSISKGLLVCSTTTAADIGGD